MRLGKAVNTVSAVSVPSKIFLLGEYVALNGGPTLVLTVEPRFKLCIATAQNSLKADRHPIFENIHPASPAGKFIGDNVDFFNRYRILFKDPHNGLGGFGASSAQFIMVYALMYPEFNDFELLQAYAKYAWNGEGRAPSGADVIAQVHGGLCFFHKSARCVETFPWPFSDLGYCLIHTGNKIATHNYLKTLTDVDSSPLEEITCEGLDCIKQRDSQRFVTAVNHFNKMMQELGLVALPTLEILKELSEEADILAAKGCGALGADVILIIFQRKIQSKVLASLENKKLRYIAYGNQVSKGLMREQPL